MTATTTEKRITVAIPDGYEFDRFDAETGEAVYRAKVRTFAIDPKGSGENVYAVGSNCEVESLSRNGDRYCQRRANVFNFDADETRAERRAAFQAAWNKLAYIADELNPAGWEPVYGDALHTIGYDDDGLTADYFNDSQFVGTVYFHSKEAAQTALDALTVDERRALFFQHRTW